MPDFAGWRRGRGDWSGLWDAVLEPLSVGRKLSSSAHHFVIPAQAGSQAVPRQRAEATQERRRIDRSTPAHELTADLGTAWVPAFAGMTK